MRWIHVLVVFVAGTALLAAEEKARSLSFVKEDAGRLPKGWQAARTGAGEGSVWKVVADATAPSGSGYVLAQTAAGPTRLFNLCVVPDTSYQNVMVSVQFKSVQGKIDQGGGVVWRYQDPNNYYICRYNPLEENLRVYKVVAGRRMQLETEEALNLPADKWHTLAVTQEGDHIVCKLNGKPYLDVKDGTIAKAGKVGLWTKADAVTYFDRFTVAGK